MRRDVYRGRPVGQVVVERSTQGERSFVVGSEEEQLRKYVENKRLGVYSADLVRSVFFKVDGFLRADGLWLVDDQELDLVGVLAFGFWGLVPGYGALGTPKVLQDCQCSDFYCPHRWIVDACLSKYGTSCRVLLADMVGRG